MLHGHRVLKGLPASEASSVLYLRAARRVRRASSQPGSGEPAGGGGILYLILWEFRVRPGREHAFERAYGPAGDWARLFRRVEGYVDTRLLADPEDPGRYVTVDRWTSREAFETFRERLSQEYEALDRSFGELTEEERKLGAFLDLENPGPT